MHQPLLHPEGGCKLQHAQNNQTQGDHPKYMRARFDGSIASLMTEPTCACTPSVAAASCCPCSFCLTTRSARLAISLPSAAAASVPGPAPTAPFSPLAACGPRLVCARVQKYTGSWTKTSTMALTRAELSRSTSIVVTQQRRKSPHVPRQPKPSTMSPERRKGTSSGTRRPRPASKAMPKSMCTSSPVFWSKSMLFVWRSPMPTTYPTMELTAAERA
mmetsp:Transcript_159720/g.297763  ORF Transcript_159720/g.297763 Transcript_159720/m.297763 type:complete len:217 (-) Transcript_159720:3873-4523(-)